MNFIKGVIATFLIGMIQHIIFIPQLPQKVAIHFNTQGIPDRWSSIVYHTMSSILFLTILTLVWLLLPRLLRIMPPSLLNLPNKKYWLAPPRREESIQKVTQQLYFLGILTNLYIFVLNQQIFKANLMQPVQLELAPVLAANTIFLGSIIIWIIYLYRDFRKPLE